MKKNRGPVCFENWKASERGELLKLIAEYPLFTDAEINSYLNDSIGPFKILNTCRTERDVATPAIILRIEEYIELDQDKTSQIRTDVSRYHGGSLADEIAALISLCLGIRIKAGGMTRWFRKNDDPLGYPLLHFADNPTPFVNYVRKPILPNLRGWHTLLDAKRISNLPKLSEEDGTTLVRAARMYQDGIWIAETEPELAWLMLVSAIETAAGHWRKTSDSPVERLKISKPELITILDRIGGTELVQLIAEAFSETLGATKKFVDFMIRFQPAPPLERPPLEEYQIKWVEEELNKIFKTIYAHRSRALHTGIPFPAPMCQAPIQFENNAFSEKPIGLAAHAISASWKAKDMPLLIHTFEYMVRNTLLNWWDSIVQ